MVSLQETYSTRHPIGFHGDCAQNDTGKRDPYEAADAIPYGRVVKKGTTDGTCVLGVAGPQSGQDRRATSVLGFAKSSRARIGQSPNDQYAVGQEVTVVSEGTVYVQVAAAVTRGNKVLVNGDTGELSGGSQGDLTASPKIYELEGWRWTLGAGAGEIAELRVGRSLATAGESRP